MPDIQSLTTRVQELSSKVDWWNNAVIVSLVFAAFAAALVGGATYKAFRRAKQLAAAQNDLSSAKESQLKKELKDKDLQISGIQDDTAKATRNAAEAETKAEGFRLSIATANKQAEEAKERAAQAALELAKFKTPRTLTPEQRKRISAKAKPFAGTTFDVAASDSKEPIDLVVAICLTSAEMGAS